MTGGAFGSNEARKQVFVERYGPWALVSGASDGIGRATAELLGSVGLNLVLVARSGERLSEIAKQIEAAHGIDVHVHTADLSNRQALAALAMATAGKNIGLVVAAAGFGTSGPFLAGDLDTELNMLDLNCGAVLGISHLFGQRLATRGAGGLVLFGSLVGWQGVPNASSYAATKAYVQALGEGLAIELRPKGIDVLTVAPGPVGSGFANRADMQMGATDTPDMIARAVVHSLGRTASIVPGRLGRLLTYSLAPLPRLMRSRILGQVMGGMTKHRADTADKPSTTTTAKS